MSNSCDRDILFNCNKVVGCIKKVFFFFYNYLKFFSTN